jgi:peptidoglycan hydrolase-like protein with peptidoglycan-binding domain
MNKTPKFVLALLLVVTACSSEVKTDEKYLTCAEYRVVSERELPLVKCDQSRLIGKLQELLGIPVTEKFDVGTAISVEKFQLSQGLLISKSIDIDTINRISEIFGNGLNGEACIFNISQPLRPWKKCDYNNEIIPFQRYLGIEADGFIGPGTVKAIELFQSDNGLTVTGVIDDVTWSRFIDLSN